VKQQVKAFIFGDSRSKSWRGFALLFLGAFWVSIGLMAGMVLLADPYNVFPFSLPISRPLISVNQRFVYPQVVRSGQFDSLVIGTSTSRLLDPERLNQQFNARFANLAMDGARAWEEKTMAEYFFRHVGTPKVMIVGIDFVWCIPEADRERITFRGFPDWLYDDDYLKALQFLLNPPTVENAGRIFGYNLGLYRQLIRYDGHQVFLPPDETYDAAKASQTIWGGPPRAWPLDAPPATLTDSEKIALRFPALVWLDDILKATPSTLKIVAFMPIHIAAQHLPGSRYAAVDNECKSRITKIATDRGARVIDWLFASPITTKDSNYWDPLHFRMPIAQRLMRELGPAILEGHPSEDGSYRLLPD
jgi:hypothetical protein